MNDKLTIDERMEIWDKRKEEKLKDRRKENDLKDIKGCTFTPKINPVNEKVLKNYPSNIAGSEFQRSGLQSYFQRKEHARKMIERTKFIQTKSTINRSRNNSHCGSTIGKSSKINDTNINQAIINLHDNLHQINM